MQTYEIYNGPERVTIQPPEEAVILKRCSGTKAKGMKWCQLTYPHYAEISNLVLKRGKPGSKCRECDRIYRSPYFGPEIGPNIKRCCGPKGGKHHYTDRANFHKSSEKKDGLRVICSTCRLVADKQWYKENPARVRAYGRKNVQIRKSRKALAFVEDVQAEKLLELYGNHCFLGCGRDVTTLPETWHIEHVIPLSRGGKHSYENTRVACADCNLKKRTKTYWEVVTGTKSGWKNFTLDNLYLFNENARWHSQQIIQKALDAQQASTNTSKDSLNGT